MILLGSLACCMTWAEASHDQRDQAATVIQFLSDSPGPIRRTTADLPKCILRGLARWYEIPFVLIEKGEEFPKLKDIRRAGDGRFRLLFFSELKGGKSVLCFEDHTSLGVTNRALIFNHDRNRCTVFTDFAFGSPLDSIGQLQSAIRNNR